MICPHCGNEQNDGVQFCTECGKRITIVPAETSAPAEAQAAQPAQKEPALASAPEPEAERPECPASDSTQEDSQANAAPESAPVPAEAQPAPKATPVSASTAASATVYHHVLDPRPDKTSRWATIGTAGWFGILLLMAIPLVNLICLLVWSFGGARKFVKQSFARAMLILGLIQAILDVVGIILLGLYGPQLIDRLFLLLSGIH